MATDTLNWILATIDAHQGAVPPFALEQALDTEDEKRVLALRKLLTTTLQVTRNAAGELCRVRDRLEGASFRITPGAQDLADGHLALGGAELGLVLACGGVDDEPGRLLSWRGLEAAGTNIQSGPLVASPGGVWALSGLKPWFEATQFEPGDDVVVHVRDLSGP